MHVAEKHHSVGFQAGRRLIGPAALAAIVILFNWKLVLTNQYTWLESPDMAHQVLPWFQFQASEWHRFQFPMWEPGSWGGQPLFGQGQPGSAYPPNWLLFLVPFRNFWIRIAALNWYLVLIRCGAALACYALCRDLGRSRAGSILGACLYALGGYVGNTMWPQMINGAVWTPLVFLFLFRVAREEKVWASAVLSGFFLGVGWLSGHHQMNLFVSLASAGVWLWLICTKNRNLGPVAAVSLGVAVLASGFQTVPMAEYGSRALRWVGSPADPIPSDQPVPYNVHEQYSLRPESVLGIVVPSVEDRNPPYVGVAGFALALLGVLLGWKHRAVRWLMIIALGGLAFALGPNTPLHGALYALFPLVEKARVPGAATLLLAIGLAPLAAFGWDFIEENGGMVRRVVWWLAGAGIVAAVASFVFTQVNVAPRSDHRLMVPAIGAFALAGLLTAIRSGSISLGAGGVAVIALALFELSNVTNYHLSNRNVPEQNPYLRRLSQHSDLVEYIRARGEAYRISYDDAQIPYNIGAWYGIETLNSLTASVPSNIWRMDLFSPRGQDFFGVRYHLGLQPSRPDQIEVFQGSSGVKVYENRRPLPRVWSVHRTTTATDARERIADPSFDALTTAFTMGASLPELETCEGKRDEVQMPWHAPNFVQIKASMGCRGLVVLTDTWFPGWRAEVDGRRAEIHEVYGGVRGVVVDAGEHTIEMRYRPWSVMAGFAMTFTAGAIALIAFRRTGFSKT